MTPKVLYQFRQCAGKPFRPSNGTDGDIFMDSFCFNCIHERWTHRQKEDRDEDKCEIMSRSLLYDANDDRYPKEWVYDEDGWPVCTKWKKFDWGTGDDPHEPPPEPEDPAQLLMPFSLAELMGELWGDEVVVTKHAIIEREVLEALTSKC